MHTSSLNSHAPKHRLFVALALLAPLFVAERASAAESCGDIVCPDGYTCETAIAPCPPIACLPGESCVHGCEPVEQAYCAQAPCEADAECGEGMVCYEHVRENCAQTAPATPPRDPCPPGAECAPVPPEMPVESEECTTYTERLCTPRSTLPCRADADCGAGFRCEERESCGTSGSPGTGGPEPMPTPSDSGAGAGESPAPAALPAPPVVTCEPSGVFSCVAIEVACTTDSDCVSGWSCRDNPEGVCWSGPNGEQGCSPADPPKLCVPPHASVPTGGPRGEGTNIGGPGISNPASGQPPASPQGPGSAPAPESPDDFLDTPATQGGCAMTPGRSGSSGIALLVLSLASVLGLRRRR